MKKKIVSVVVAAIMLLTISLQCMSQPPAPRGGYSAQACNDGAKGLEIAVSEKFDLILLDLMLPHQWL